MTVPKNTDNPVIQESTLAHPTLCIVCGSDNRVTRYDFRTGEHSRYTIAWCGLCLKKVALFLTEATLHIDVKPCHCSECRQERGRAHSKGETYTDHNGYVG